MKGSIHLIASILIAGVLTGCGTTEGERTLSGAGLGAAAGAGVGLLTGANTIGAALLGGLGGAAAGAITEPDDVYLGEPVWE